MTKHDPIPPIKTPAWEAVRLSEWATVMTPEKFANGCFIRTDAHTGKQWGTGETSFGLTVTLPLGVPLCKGCDGEIIDHQCPDCELVFLEDGVKLDNGRASIWA